MEGSSGQECAKLSPSLNCPPIHISCKGVPCPGVRQQQLSRRCLLLTFSQGEIRENKSPPRHIHHPRPQIRELVTVDRRPLPLPHVVRSDPEWKVLLYQPTDPNCSFPSVVFEFLHFLPPPPCPHPFLPPFSLCLIPLPSCLPPSFPVG